MDPDATWRILITEDQDDYERDEAALRLLVWLANGGLRPRRASTRAVIETCELRLFDALDRLDRALDGWSG